MNNREMLDYMDKQFNEVKTELKEMRAEHKQLHKDFYMFRGKIMGFVSIVSFVLAIAVDFIKKKLGI